LPKLFRHR